MKLFERIFCKSLSSSAKERSWAIPLAELAKAVPDITDQYSKTVIKNGDIYMIQKIRQLHCFQVLLALESIKAFFLKYKRAPLVIDIGDSSGAHIRYLKHFCIKEKIPFKGISINLDPIAVDKIKNNGGDAILCRAEELQKNGIDGDILLSFEMLEHLMDPFHFLKNISENSKCDSFCISVPYLKQSRVGLSYIRNNKLKENMSAESVHILELSSDDWDLVFRFSGWEIIKSEKYFQYPKRNIFILTKPFWKRWDFEGFYGVILKRNLEESNCYLDW